jgi:two-component system cell cycle sensor histidine kinase/response regulator CckA
MMGGKEEDEKEAGEKEEASTDELESLRAENARLRAETERLQHQLTTAQSRFQQIVSGSPLLVRELDVQPLLDHFARLRVEGVTDFGAYFDLHPDQVPLCVNLALVVYANRNLLDLYGAQNGAELQEALAREMTPERWHIARDLLTALADNRPLPSFETYVRTLENVERYLITQVSYLNDADPPTSRALFLSIDATRYRRMEEQLRLTQKMESLGRLAGGIAHDFNNLLAIIHGFAELAEADLPSEDPSVAHLVKIQTAAQRGRDITDRLLALAHKQVFTPQTLDPGLLVDKATELIRDLLGPNVTLEVRKEEPLWTVQAHAGQFEQMLFNLVVNARDAMPEGGKLLLALQNVRYAPELPDATSDLRTHEFVCLTMQDTGVGMSADLRRRIFEPFFTTKPVGQGTGLGLSTVYSIVAQNGGYIEVESELGQGATFCIYLPRRCDISAEQTHLPVAGQFRGVETILLAEDETALREMAATWLQRRGYTVLTAANGTEAAHTAVHYEGQIHLLLTDVIMPQMSGLELARHLGPLFPQMRILFVTGYPGDPLIQDHDLTNQHSILQKPYSLSQLEIRVRAALDRP